MVDERKELLTENILGGYKKQMKILTKIKRKIVYYKENPVTESWNEFFRVRLSLFFCFMFYVCHVLEKSLLLISLTPGIKNT